MFGLVEPLSSISLVVMETTWMPNFSDTRGGTLVVLHSISIHHAKSCKMGHDTPPPYTSSAPSPRYSSGLLPGEQTVELTRHASSRRPTGVYRRITDHLTIVLRDQHPGNVYPMYGRSGVIQGDVILSNVADDLTSVIFLSSVRWPHIIWVIVTLHSSILYGNSILSRLHLIR